MKKEGRVCPCKSLFYSKTQSVSPVLFVVYTLLLLLLTQGFLSYSAQRLGNWHFDSVRTYLVPVLKGYGFTLFLSFIVLCVASIFGVVLSLLQRSGVIFAKVFIYWLIQICRGTPLIVFIVFSYYIVAQAIGLQERVLAGILILSIYYATAITEIIRGGFKAIPATQFEVARSFGLSTFGIYWHVIFPQLIQKILPAMMNQIGIIVKDTSLMSVIGVAEFYQVSTNAANQTYASLEFFLILAVGYLLITLPISILVKFLENREAEAGS